MQKNIGKIEAKNARILAISVDGAEDNQKLTEKLQLSFPLYQDKDLAVIKAWKVENPKKELALPATFVVDTEGKILFQYIGERNPDRPTVESILEVL